MDEKYLKLLDEEVIDFIKRTEAFYPADAASASIDKQREYYDALCREFDEGYPRGITASDRQIKVSDHMVSVRDYVCVDAAQKAHVLFYHGGGFILGGLESHDSICAEICGRTGCAVTAVDYRLAPEHLHPAAFDDALGAFLCIAEEAGLPVILVGDSAGGNLAAAVCHATRTEKCRPAGQVLIYPGLGGDVSTGSYVEHGNAPMLTTADMEFYHAVRMPTDAKDKDISTEPLADDDFSDLPPTVIISAECDPLSDDGRVYRDCIIEAGGKAVWFNEEGLVHGYLRARSSVKRAADSMTRIVEAIEMLADGRWA